MSDELQFHGYLDRFTVVGNCVVAEGWTNERDLALWYRGRPIVISVSTIDRPDLTTAFGEDARRWGFSMAAALPDRIVDRSQFKLRFNAGLTVDPTAVFCRHDDHKFDLMLARFRDSVRPGSSLLEIGSRARSGAVYREWFPEQLDYVGLDVTDGPNVDVVGDAHHLSRSLHRSFDHVFSMATFEHILMPWKVALEMNKVMRTGGTALIISHGVWPLHEEPWDFFRFSKESWGGLFNAHTGFRLVDAQYKYGAAVIPQYLESHHHAEMSLGNAYLLSGCVVERVGEALVEWNAEAGKVYDMEYSHA